MPDGTSYEVVPGALRKMAAELADVTVRWKGFVAEVDGLALGDNDLGALGSWVDYPGSYNTVKDFVKGKLDEGTTCFTATSETLDEVARHYEKKDAKWYEEFGYIEEEM